MSLPRAVSGLTMPPTGIALDSFGRAHSYLRLSVTDRCNFRCTYCMPEEGMKWLKKERLLRFEEIHRIVRLMVGMGVRRVRLTGGEPLLRTELTELVRMLAEIPGLDDLSMTTNGHLLPKFASDLARAGLHRVNVSLDSVDPDQFSKITRGGDLHRVLRGIDAALDAGLTPVKINAVIVAGENEGQVERLVAHFTPYAGAVQVRFIEAMPFSGTQGRTHLSSEQMRQRLSERLTLVPCALVHGGGPARMWRVQGTELRVGFISPMTEHFCEGCNRLRLMADGSLRTCLSRDEAPSLKVLLRTGGSDSDVVHAIRTQIWQKVAGHEAHNIREWRAFEGNMSQIGG